MLSQRLAASCAAIVLALATLSAPAFAADLGNLEIVDCRTHNEAQEKADLDLATQALQVMQTHNQAKLNQMLPDLKAALDHAPDMPAKPEHCGDTINIYSDNIADLLAVTAILAGHEKEIGASQALQKAALPYPLLAFVVGWIEYENGDYQAAHEAYAKGLKNDPDYHSLVMEDTLALAFIGRSADALQQLDAYLARNNDLDDKDMAAAQRKRGYVLVELGRWDEAEKAYKDSLRLEPGNTIAQGELDYIKQHKKK